MKNMEMDRKSQYEKNSLTLVGAISMGTAVIIGAGIFALTGQIAEQAGSLFPLAFIVAAIVVGFSAYSYVKLSNAYPSAGGIVMFLKEAYGPGLITAAGGLLMYLSMVINESLVARTFGTYVLQPFSIDDASILVPILAVLLLIFAFLMNISGTKLVGKFSLIMTIIKIGGLALFGIIVLGFFGFSFDTLAAPPGDSTTIAKFIGGVALAILAYKGFTTITNSGSEIKQPHKNVGRAIIYSIFISVVLYLLVAFAVAGSLSMPEIIEAKNFVLAAAARPVLGDLGVWLTVFIAIVATVSSIIASTFAVSRMLAMLTDMKLVPHRHFGMKGTIQKHTLVYTILLAIFLTVFLDLGRIASLGAILYLIMDIGVHWGVFKHLKGKVDANPAIVLTAIILEVVVLVTFLGVKAQSDMLVIYASVLSLVAIFGYERYYLRTVKENN